MQALVKSIADSMVEQGMDKLGCVERQRHHRMLLLPLNGMRTHACAICFVLHADVRFSKPRNALERNAYQSKNQY